MVSSKVSSAADAIRSKGLVSVRNSTKALQHMYINELKFMASTHKRTIILPVLSGMLLPPLLRIAAEVCKIIFKHAMIPSYSIIHPIFNSQNRLSRSSTSTRAGRAYLNKIGISLPATCHQIYSETATLLYSTNTFSFFSIGAM